MILLVLLLLLISSPLHFLNLPLQTFWIIPEKLLVFDLWDRRYHHLYFIFIGIHTIVFFLLLIKLKINIILFLLVKLDFKIFILIIVLVLFLFFDWCHLLILFSLDSCDTIFTVPFFNRIELKL